MLGPREGIYFNVQTIKHHQTAPKFMAPREGKSPNTNSAIQIGWIMMFCQIWLEYLKQFNLDSVRVSWKVKMNQRHPNPGVFAGPQIKCRTIEQEVFPRSKPLNITKEIHTLKLTAKAPWNELPFWRVLIIFNPFHFQVLCLLVWGSVLLFPRRSNLSRLFDLPVEIDQFEFLNKISANWMEGGGVTSSCFFLDVSTTCVILPEAPTPTRNRYSKI